MIVRNMMKRLLYLVFALSVAIACTGTIDPSDQPGNEPGGDDEVVIPDEYKDKYASPYTLSVDKDAVEADGKDAVTFSLKDAYGRDILTDKNALQSVNIFSEEGMVVPRMTTDARFIANGTYTFKAMYKGEMSENTVTVKANNRAKYEKFHKNVAIYKATATWCGPCAYMTRALESLNEDARNHSVELCWHYQDDLAIMSPGSTYDCGTVMVSYFGGSGVPTVVLDLQEMVIEKSASTIENAIWQLRADYPATCGLKVDTGYDKASGMIDIDVELMSSTGGRYDIGLAVLLNDQTVPGGTNDDGRYTHIVRAATGNYLMYSTNITDVAEGGTMTFSQQVGSGNLDVDDLSVVAWALVEHEEKARIDNIVEVKVGESVGYVLND